jgi:hypothetical protein
MTRCDTPVFLVSLLLLVKLPTGCHVKQCTEFTGVLYSSVQNLQQRFLQRAVQE